MRDILLNEKLDFRAKTVDEAIMLIKELTAPKFQMCSEESKAI